MIISVFARCSTKANYSVDVGFAVYAAAEEHHSEQLYGLCDSYREIMKANSWASEVSPTPADDALYKEIV